MTPSLTQRLGLAPLRLESGDRRRLLAARVGAVLFALEATLVLVASAFDGGGAGGLRLLFSAASAYGLGAVILLTYDRLNALGANLVALAGTASVTLLVLSPELGGAYRILYVWLALYVAFFMPRRQAAFQVAVIVFLGGGALAATMSAAQAIELWIVSSGIIVGAAAFTSYLRDHLVRLVAKANQARAELDAFFLHAPAGFGFLDNDLRHMRVNEALAEIMWLERDEIEGRLLSEVAPVNAPVLEPLARRTIESGEPVLGVEIFSPDGRCHLVSYYPIPNRDGVVGVGTAVTDVTHLKDVEKRLEETNERLTILATTDELTRLPNRRLFAEQLELALARARRGGLAVAVLCLDLDSFKGVNDSLGHALGDELLIEIATRLRSGARETDVVARYGGDEFVILVADLDVQLAPQLAATVVERLRSLLSEPFAIGPVELLVEASIGVAFYPSDSREAEGLLAAADADMYRGKSGVTRVA